MQKRKQKNEGKRVSILRVCPVWSDRDEIGTYPGRKFGSDIPNPNPDSESTENSESYKVGPGMYSGSLDEENENEGCGPKRTHHNRHTYKHCNLYEVKGGRWGLCQHKRFSIWQ